MDAALSLDDVWLTLPAASGPVEILKGVSFRAMPGESVAVVGPSGSGKSSLIAVSTGIERVTKGDLVEYRRLNSLDRKESFESTMTALLHGVLPMRDKRSICVARYRRAGARTNADPDCLWTGRRKRYRPRPSSNSPTRASKASDMSPASNCSICAFAIWN